MDKPTPPPMTLAHSSHIAEAMRYGEAMAAWGAAQERKALLDCRTCRQHTTVSGGCLSVLQCVEGSAYQPTVPRRIWAQQGD